jgi:hypothetical protein
MMIEVPLKIGNSIELKDYEGACEVPALCASRQG